MLKNDLIAAATGEKPLFSYCPLLQIKVSHLGNKFLLQPATQAQLQLQRANVFPTYPATCRPQLHEKVFFLKKCIYRRKIRRHNCHVALKFMMHYRRNVLRLAGTSVWNPNQMQEINRDVSPDSSGWYVPLSQDNSCSVQGRRLGHTAIRKRACMYSK